MPLDELGVHPGDVDLPQVKAAGVMCVDPQDGGQQPGPFGREAERPHRVPGQPRQQSRCGGLGRGKQVRETSGLLGDLQQGAEPLEIVDPDTVRDLVGADGPATDPLALYPHELWVHQLPSMDPALRLSKACGDLAGARPAQRHLNRLPRRAVHRVRQPAPGFPLLPHALNDIRGSRPAG